MTIFITTDKSILNKMAAFSKVEKSEKRASLYVVADSRYFIDPKGKIYPVDRSHEEWIYDNIKLLQEQYGLWKNHPEELYPEETDNINAIIPMMLRDGWARVGDLFGIGKGYYGKGIEIADINNVQQNVFDFVSNYGKDKYFTIEDLRKRYVEVSVADLLQDGQEAINSHLRSDKLVHASLLTKYWLDPNGKEYALKPNEHHMDWVRRTQEIPASLGMEEVAEVGQEMLDEGWTRVGDGDNSFQFVLEVASFDHLPSYLDDFVANHFDANSDKGIAISANPPNYVEITNPFPSLQQAVQKQLRRKKVHASLDSKYWIDPNGKEFSFAPDDSSIGGHLGWIPKNKELLKSYGIDPNIHGSYGHIAVADDMIASGWTRITTESDYDFAAEVADLTKLPVYLDDFIAKHYTGGGIEIDDLTGEYQDVQDPFPSIQKQVNKARMLRRQPVHAALSKKELIAQTKKVKQGDYSCLLGLVPHDLAQEIVAFGVNLIPDDALYVDDNAFGRELETHVTIKYGLVSDDAKTARRLFNDHKPFKVKLGKVKHFEPDVEWGNFDVVTIEVESEDLKQMNKEVCEKLECAKGLPSDEYKPHITIAYVKKGKGKDFIGSSEFEGREIELDTVVFSPARGNKTYFSISQDKESQFILEKINKTADLDRMWVDPSGQVYYLEGDTHASWIVPNLEMLERDYGFKIPKKVWNQRMTYYKSVEQQGDEDNLNLPDIWGVIEEMFKKGWVRIGDPSASSGIGIELLNLRAIPPFLDNILAKFLKNGEQVVVEDKTKNSVTVTYPFKSLQQVVNKALSSPTKTARNNFFPSLVQPADQNWTPDSDVEIPIDPDAESDELTDYAPCTTGKPRNPEVWRQVIPMMMKPLSKKESASYPEQLVNIGNITFTGKKKHVVKVEVPQDLLDQYFATVIDMKKGLRDPKLTNKDFRNEYWSQLDRTRVKIHDELVKFAFNRLFEGKNWYDFPSISFDIRDKISQFVEDLVPSDDLPKESAFDPAQEAIEKKELGEDETLLEFSKGFKDLNKSNSNKPSTTWPDNSSSQGGEPYAPLPSFHVETNPDNESWRYPWKFVRRPIGDDSNQNEVLEMLMHSALSKKELQKKASFESSYWIDPQGKSYSIDTSEDETHMDWVGNNLEILMDKFGLPETTDIHPMMESMFVAGWTRAIVASDALLFDRGNLKNLSSLDDFVSQHWTPSKKEIIIDIGIAQQVTVSNPFPSLQNAVNKALQQKRLGKKAGNGFGGWISPEGEFISTQDHLGFMSEHPEVFGFTKEDVNSLKDADDMMYKAIENGWVAIRTWGTILVIRSNHYFDARKAEEQILDISPKIALIRIETLDGHTYRAKVEDFIDRKWRAFLKIAKQAGNLSTCNHKVGDVIFDPINKCSAKIISIDNRLIKVSRLL